LFAGLWFVSSAQIVDQIKSSSDNFQDNSTTVFDNEYEEESDYVPQTVSQPRQSSPQFGGSVPPVIFQTRVVDPEGQLIRSFTPSVQFLQDEEFPQLIEHIGAESNWAYTADQIRQMEEAELDRFLFEEARRGRFRRWHGHARLQGVTRSEYGIALPRVGIGYGPITTELRINHIVEPGVSFIAHYRTWDWQIASLRLMDFKHCSWSIGIGVIFEEYNAAVFEEYITEVKLNFFEGRLSIPIEGRMALQDGLITRLEASGIANWMFYGGDHSKISLSLGYVRQSYFLEVMTGGPVIGAQLELF